MRTMYNIEDQRPTDPPTDRPPCILENFERPYLATGHPIHFMFGSRVGFSRSADRTDLLPVGSNPRWQLAAILDNFKWPYLWNGSSDRLRVRY